MRFEMKQIRASDSGFILAIQDVSDEIIRNISIEETVGDEQFIKASELVIETKRPLPMITALPQTPNWFALYIEGNLWNVYQHPGENAWIERDDRSEIYKYRLYPIQKTFYDDLARTAVEYSTDANNWNYSLDGTTIEISQITIIAEDGTPLTEPDRYGFSLAYLLEALIGKDNDYGYLIGNVVHPLVRPNGDDLAIIFRGTSKPGSASFEEVINFTFKQSDLPGSTTVFNLKWLDIFKWAAFGWNAWINVVPVLSDDYLRIWVYLIPRTWLGFDSPITTLKWIQRKYRKNRYQIDGVRFTGNNFEYAQGNVNGANVISRTIDISDYNDATTFEAKENLYWAAGDYDSGDGKYDLTAPYFGSGLVQPYYDFTIESGHGFEGEVKATYEANDQVNVLRVLDQVQIDDSYIQVHQIRLDASGRAQIEGMEFSAA